MGGICKLGVTIKSIAVHSNGQVPLPLTSTEIASLSNAVTATVLYPDSASNALVGAVSPTLVNRDNTDITFNFDLDNPDGAHPPNPKHPAARLFRYLILDNTDGQGSPLYIDVTETVKASILAKAVGLALGGALGAGAGLIPGGQIVSGAVKGLACGLGTVISQLGNASVSIIGSASTRLYADQLLAAGKQELTLDLISGKKPISQNWFIPGQFNPNGTPVEKGETVLIPANTKNGSITLILQAFPNA
ncbi:MAG: hypothetical protein ABSH45_20700 [Bryobacteraceae bacterium]|jgi:hypothetical protein